VGRSCGTGGRGEKSVQGLVGNSEGKRPLERPRRTWLDGIKIDLMEIGCGQSGSSWLRTGAGGRLL
jgi:hypothetical protein